MKKGTFQQTLFNAGRGLKNWGKTHATEAATAALATATLAVGTAFGVDALRGTNPAFTATEPKPILLSATVKPIDNEVETKKMLKDIVAKMDLTPEQIEQLCRDYDLPREIFNQTAQQENGK